MSKDDLNLVVDVDESILTMNATFDDIFKIDMSIWGQGFNPPSFTDEFTLVSQKTLMNKHTKCQLSLNGKVYEAIFFNFSETLPDKIKAIYSIEANEFRGSKKIQLILRDLI